MGAVGKPRIRERPAELELEIPELEDVILGNSRRGQRPCQSRRCERTWAGSASGG